MGCEPPESTLWFGVFTFLRCDKWIPSNFIWTLLHFNKTKVFVEGKSEETKVFMSFLCDLRAELCAAGKRKRRRRKKKCFPWCYWLLPIVSYVYSVCALSAVTWRGVLRVSVSQPEVKHFNPKGKHRKSESLESPHEGIKTTFITLFFMNTAGVCCSF